jgi:hypothetical protein
MKIYLAMLFMMLICGQSSLAAQEQSDPVDRLTNCPLWLLIINDRDGSSRGDLLKVIPLLQGLNLTGGGWSAASPNTIRFSVNLCESMSDLAFYQSPQGLSYRQNLAQSLSSIGGIQVSCKQNGQTNPRGTVSN